MDQWLDRHMGRLFLTPAVVLILIFSIFPLLASAVLAMGVALFLGLLRGYWRTYVAAGAMRRPHPGRQTPEPANDYGGLPVLARIADRSA